MNSIKNLTTEEKLALLKALDEQLQNEEEALLESDPTIRMEIKEAREAYKTHNYVTLEEYIAKKSPSK